MEDKLLDIGCDGGSIILQRVLLHGVFLFKIKSSEFFSEATEKSTTYLNIDDAWCGLKENCPHWHQLYLVSISAQMVDILKNDYIYITNKNEHTKDRWLEQLIGYGLGF
ncbi:MAG TPA: hypothetical protein VIM89_05560 [Mucilaginibacter sp.]